MARIIKFSKFFKPPTGKKVPAKRARLSRAEAVQKTLAKYNRHSVAYQRRLGGLFRRGILQEREAKQAKGRGDIKSNLAHKKSAVLTQLKSKLVHREMLLNTMQDPAAWKLVPPHEKSQVIAELAEIKRQIKSAQETVQMLTQQMKFKIAKPES